LDSLKYRFGFGSPGVSSVPIDPVFQDRIRRLCGRRCRKGLIVVIYIKMKSQADLLQVVYAGGMPSLLFALAKAGKSRPARIAIMAITTSSSIKVKALSLGGRQVKLRCWTALEVRRESTPRTKERNFWLIISVFVVF